MHPKPEQVNTLPTIQAVAQERKRLQHRSKFVKTFKSTVYILIVVAALAVLLSCIFLPVMQISGSSMEPTLQNNDIVVLVKTNRFKTGDLVCFSWNNRTLLKRVIATAGDWVSIDSKGTVFVNGEALNEPYISEPGLGECDAEFPLQIPENSYWVMGDHRESSIDSRSSVIGTVSKEQVIGKVALKVWPNVKFTIE